MSSNVIQTENVNIPQDIPGIGCLLFNRMKQHTGKIAQINTETEEKDTFDNLLLRSIRAALALKEIGIKPKDVIWVCLPHNLNSCVPILASYFLAAIPATVDYTLCTSDKLILLNSIQPKLIICDESSKEAAEEYRKAKIMTEFEELLKPKENENDFTPVKISDLQQTATILFSSGTSGLPKGVCLSHLSLLGILFAPRRIKNPFVERIQKEQHVWDDEQFTTCSHCTFSLISAIMFFHLTMAYGRTNLISPKFDPLQAWKIVEKYKVINQFLSPFQAVEMCKVGKPDNLSTESLMRVCIAGASMPIEYLLHIKKLIPDAIISQPYGQTECGGVVLSFEPLDEDDHKLSIERLTSCGKPVPGYTYKVVDPETEEILGPNKEGELRVKSNFLMNGYYNTDSSSYFDEDGFFKTGDIVYYDEDNCFFVVDRIKEMIIYQNLRISPFVIEEIFYQHPDINAAIVVGIPHKEDNMHPMAIVKVKENSTVTPEILENFVNDRVDERKKIRAGVHFVEEIPISRSGKIKRRELRDKILKKLNIRV